MRAFPCTEAGGYVFVWTGEGTPSEPPEFPDFAKYNWIQGTTPLGCSALAAIENNLDWAHPVFAHPNTHPQYFVNQAIGFGLLHYPIDTNTILWGFTIGAAALAAIRPRSRLGSVSGPVVNSGIGPPVT